MKIVVCVKQVPATSGAKIDPETKRIIREGNQAVINPLDLNAVEEAVRIRERVGGQVIALSMGPESALNTLTEALSMGADEAVLLSDRAFGGSDTWATSYALARAIDTIGDVDLVICGKQAVDGDTAQVGAGIAAKLGIMQAANVEKVETIEDDSITVTRLNERGWDEVKLQLPALITVIKDTNVPRVPSLRNARIARKKEIPIWKPADINASEELIGLKSSPTQVVKVAPPEARSGVSVKLDGADADTPKALIDALTQKGLIKGKGENA